MRETILAALLCFILMESFAQTQRKIAIFLGAQYDLTLKDATKQNNLWGIGLSGQVFFHNNKKLKPLLDMSANGPYLSNKVLLTHIDGTPVQPIEGLVNIFAGVCWQAVHRAYVSVVAGPSFVSGQVLLGIKPSFGFRFPANERFDAKISLINIFNREQKARENFSSLSFSMGIRLF